MIFLRSCLESGQIITNNFNENSVLTGVSDTIIVKQKDGTYKTTPFLVSFGPYYAISKDKVITLIVNNALIQQVTFNLDKKGYVYPQYLTDKQIRKMRLRFGVNNVIYKLQECEIQAEVYLYADNDKFVVSDVDGTVTKNDLGGHANNIIGRDYLHEGYANLIKTIYHHGYQIVWLTMRSLPLYQYSKRYLRKTVGIDGPIMMEPEQFLVALKNEVTKKTGNIKANMMNLLRQLFPTNPFIAGLGNRQNDAVAYLHAGISLDKIFIIDTKSRVQQMSSGSTLTTYNQMCQQSQFYFPKYFAPKMGYK